MIKQGKSICQFVNIVYNCLRGDMMEISGMRIISIDDNRNNLLMIEVHGRALGVDVLSYESPMEALAKVQEEHFDMIIVDYMMPEMDGLTFIEAFRKIDIETPIIMITAAGDDDNIHFKALQLGATDFLKKPLNGALFKLRVKNLLLLEKSRILVKDKAKLLEEEVRKATEIVRNREMETLTVVGKTAEYKDPETAEHIARVAGYSLILAQAYGLNENMQNILKHSAPLHDIGKVGIPDYILLKPASLNEEEWEIMMTHTLIGYNILKRTQSKYLNAGSIIAFTHHEKWDGSGYPKGLSGENIPLLGRIVAIADVFDALTMKRPYKEAWEFEEAVDEIKNLSGQHFDPSLVKLLIENLDKFRHIYHNLDGHKDKNNEKENR